MPPWVAALPPSGEFQAFHLHQHLYMLGCANQTRKHQLTDPPKPLSFGSLLKPEFLQLVLAVTGGPSTCKKYLFKCKSKSKHFRLEMLTIQSDAVLLQQI